MNTERWLPWFIRTMGLCGSVWFGTRLAAEWAVRDAFADVERDLVDGGLGAQIAASLSDAGCHCVAVGAEPPVH